MAKKPQYEEQYNDSAEPLNEGNTDFDPSMFSEEDFTVDYSDTWEPEELPLNEEIQLTITRASVWAGKDKNGQPKKAFMLTFEDTSNPKARSAAEFLSLPSPHMGVKEENSCKLRFKHFAAAFGLEEPFRPILAPGKGGKYEVTNLVGLSGFVTLKDKKPSPGREQYGNQLVIDKYVIPAA